MIICPEFQMRFKPMFSTLKHPETQDTAQTDALGGFYKQTTLGLKINH